MESRFIVRWGPNVSTAQFVLPCNDFPFRDPTRRDLVYRDRVSLTHYLYTGSLRLVCIGSRHVICLHMAELLGAGAGQIFDDLYSHARKTSPFISELDVLMPTNTIDRIVMYLNQNGVRTA